MTMPASVKTTILVAFLIIGVSPPAIAQGVGAIGGTVQDATGAVIPGVVVVLSNPGTIGGNQQAVTDDRGAYFSGWPEDQTVTVGRNTVALTQVSQSLRVGPRDGSVRLPSVTTVDLAGKRTFRWAQLSAEPVVEVFNLWNANTTVGRTTVLGPAYHRATSILGGRVLRFGMNVKF